MVKLCKTHKWVIHSYLSLLIIGFTTSARLIVSVLKPQKSSTDIVPLPLESVSCGSQIKLSLSNAHVPIAAIAWHNLLERLRLSCETVPGINSELRNSLLGGLRSCPQQNLSITSPLGTISHAHFGPSQFYLPNDRSHLARRILIPVG